MMIQMERSRSMHPSPDQVYTLLEVMEINPLLAKGHVKSVMARQTATRHWHHLAIKLNNMGGATKTGKQWAKYWSDKKSAVKKKAIVRLTAIKQGSDSEQILELSDVEERIITLMGGEKFVVPETPKHAAINDSYKDPPGRVPDEDRDTQQANVEINNHSSRISEDGDSRQTTMVYQHPETIDDQSNRTSNVSSHFSSTLRTDESKPALDSVRSASHIRNRRPFYLTSAPTRSRRSFIRNLTEGLLRVEEQRLEMERENAQWNQKRDRMLIETFSGVCESLNASLNCLNKLTSLLTESIKKE
ncbi:uncharacterized protein LOC101741630 isoform X7 [Bombyx mori]|uniref:Regulatory protein zeste n=1 Tax=Bombyx mori TaxID=7091 RepID=A0A8R2DKX2_BOMMO|nr:uncharacterized protein LOC101741630 isoform X5 [Bombyx mori]